MIERERYDVFLGEVSDWLPGSEMNNGAVISNEETIVKSFIVSDLFYPRVAIVDPELTLNVPRGQTAFGVCDLREKKQQCKNVNWGKVVWKFRRSAWAAWE
ncbi:MAG: iron-containing alcohol dehydrogenase [Geobacteraceae bacterium]|nr:iron-containing alcohol dehydrogenase [Geobacteraceae bacterium]